MAYNDSLKTLEEMRPLLLKLEQGLEERYIVPHGMNPKTFAYKVREALHTAHLHADLYPALAKAHGRFRIRTIRQLHQVWATLREVSDLNLVLTGETPVHGLSNAGPLTAKVPGSQTAISIIQYMLDSQRLQPNNNQLGFPEANLELVELMRLYAWCQRQTPQWILLVADKSVTLARKTRDNEDVAWNPEDGL